MGVIKRIKWWLDNRRADEVGRSIARRLYDLADVEFWMARPDWGWVGVLCKMADAFENWEKLTKTEEGRAYFEDSLELFLFFYEDFSCLFSGNDTNHTKIYGRI